MTARQRRGVVELLRCAADIAASERWGLFGVGATTASWLKPGNDVCSLAERAAGHLKSRRTPLPKATARGK